MKKKRKLKIREFWTRNPAPRIKESGKRYNRKLGNSKDVISTDD